MFEENYANEGGLIFAFDNPTSVITFENSVFFNNSAENFLISLMNTEISIKNVTFARNNDNIFLLKKFNLEF